MRTWAKVLLGIAASLLLLLGLALALLVRSGRWEQAKGFAGGMAELTRSGRDLERLTQERPFTPPVDGLIQEPRLLAYLEVCEALKPFVQPYEAWMEVHAGQRGDFKVAAEAVGFLGKVTAQAAQVLRARGMPPQELAWLHRAVRRASAELQEKAPPPELQDLLADLRRAVADPGLSPALRAELRRSLERHEARVRDRPLSANARLCAGYRERIRAADLKDFSALILEGIGKGRGQAPRR